MKLSDGVCPECASNKTSKEKIMGSDTGDIVCDTCGYTGHWKEFQLRVVVDIFSGLGKDSVPMKNLQNEVQKHGFHVTDAISVINAAIDSGLLIATESGNLRKS